MQVAGALPVFKIDENCVARLDDLPSPSDKAAALEAALTAELMEDDPGFAHRAGNRCGSKTLSSPNRGVRGTPPSASIPRVPIGDF